MKKTLSLLLIHLIISSIAFSQTTLPSRESFETGFGVWMQGTSDNIDWTRWQDTTPTALTGPPGAYDGNYYIYIESDSNLYNPARKADLVGKFNFSGTTLPMLSFYYNMYGDFINNLQIFISTDSSSWTELDRIIGSQGPNWHREILCLGSYAGQPVVYIMFRGWTSDENDTNANRADIALDKIEIVDMKFVDTTVTDVTCGGYADGSINVAITGGFTPYEYSIDGGNTWTTASNDTSHLFSGLSGGAYLTQVRSGDTCVLSAGYLTVEEPPKPDIVVDTTYIKPCSYSKNGEIHITVSNGTGPFTYSITGTSGTFVSSPDFTGLDSGYYDVVVKDGTGCLYDQGNYRIDPLYDILILDVTKQDVTGCFGDKNGSIKVQAAGGYGQLTYSIDTGNTFEPSNYFGNLGAGNYFVIVKDHNNCRDTTEVITITQPSKVIINSITKQDVTGCYGDSTGSITIDAQGGTGSLKYSINKGKSYSSNNVFTSLPADDYFIVVADSNNCSAGPDTVTITQPPLLTIDSVHSTNITGCYGDSTAKIEIFASGGTPTLKYSIDNGNSFQLLNYFSNLPAGTYYPLVKDGSGCTANWTKIDITQPPQLKISSISQRNIETCYGDSTGRIIIYTTGGSSPISYSIDGGSTFHSTNNFDSLKAGTYHPYVRDSHGCVDTDVAVTLTEPPQIVITDETSGDVKCYQTQTGWIYVNATGGTGQLLYSINGGANFSYIVGDTIQTYAGTYNIQVKDNNGCIAIGTPLTVNEPSELVIDTVLVQDVTTCYGDSTGAITIQASGGTKPYKFSINGGVTLSDTNYFDSLPSASNYSPYVIDANGCVRTHSKVSIAQPPSLYFQTVTKHDIDSCHGTPKGWISVAVAGGTPPYNYSIDSGATFSTDSLFTHLYSGYYYITAKDNHDCQIWYNQHIYLKEPDTLVLDSLNYRNISCHGLQNGYIEVYASGGVRPYKYYLFNHSTNDTTITSANYFPSLRAATYTVRLEDVYHCSIDSTLTLTEPPALVIDSVTHTDVQTCYGDSTAVIKIYAHGGTAPLSYGYANIGHSVNNYYPTNIFNNVLAGSYYTMVKDDMGCTQNSVAFTIKQPNPVYINSYKTTPITCHDDNDATILIQATGGTGDLDYSIDSGMTWKPDSLFINLGQGRYALLARDQKGCTSTNYYAFNITNPPILLIDTIVVKNVKCYGAADGSLTVLARGGAKPLKYSLDSSNFQASKEFTGLDTGTYVVYVVDANNCSVKDTSGYISQPPNYALFDVDTAAGCSPLLITFTPRLTDHTTFMWYFGDSAVANTTGQVKHLYTNRTSSVQKLTAKVYAYHSLCKDSSQTQITVYPEPVLDITIDSTVNFYPDTVVDITNNTPSYQNFTWDYGDGVVEHIVHPVVHAYPGCGSYNLTVSASNSYGCYDTLRRTILITAFDPVPEFVMNKNEGCSPLEVQFYNSSSNAQSYIWDFGDGSTSTDVNPSHTFIDHGTYMVKLTAIGYCDKQKEVQKPVYVYQNPQVDFTVEPDTAGVEQPVVFDNKTVGGEFYLWDFGDGETSTDISPRKAYHQAGIYDVKLVATSINGCKDSLVKENAITVISDMFIQFPNAFTPDGDGINDYFQPKMKYVKEAELYIYDRYGNVIFYTKDPEHVFWDGRLPNGKPLPMDVYVWRIVGTFVNGKPFSKQGEVTLIR